MDERLQAEKLIFEEWKDKVPLACETGRAEILEVLLRRSDLGLIDFNANAAFLIAFKNRHKEVIKVMLEHPCNEEIDFNITDNFGTTVFMWACSHGLEDIVKWFLHPSNSNQIDFNAKDKFGKSAFILACDCLFLNWRNCKEIIKLLLKNSEKIDVNAIDRRGKTVLMNACTLGITHVVKLLLGCASIDVPSVNLNYTQEINDLLALAANYRSITVPNRKLDSNQVGNIRSDDHSPPKRRKIRI